MTLKLKTDSEDTEFRRNVKFHKRVAAVKLKNGFIEFLGICFCGNCPKNVIFLTGFIMKSTYKQGCLQCGKKTLRKLLRRTI